MFAAFGGRRRCRSWGLTLIAIAALGFFCSLARAQAPVSGPDDLIARAREAYNERRFIEAAAAYREYLDNYPAGPDRDEAAFFYGHSLFLLRDYKTAEEVFAREETRNQKYVDQILYYRGELAAIARNYDLALIFFDRLMAEHPDSKILPKARERSAEVHYKRGNLYLAKGAFSLAIQDYLLAREAPPALRPVVQYKIGLCLLKLSDHKKAAQVFNDLSLNEAPEAHDAALLARYRLARLLEDQGRFAESELAYQAFLTAAPDHFLAPLAREGLARVWAKEGKADQAIAYWREQGQGRNIAELASRYESALDHYLHEEYADGAADLEAIRGAITNQEFAWKVRIWLARTYTRLSKIDLALAAWKEVMADRDRGNDYLRLEYARFMLELDPSEAFAMAAQVADAAQPAFIEEALRLMALARAAAYHPEALAAASNYLAKYPHGRFVGEIALVRARLLLNKGDLPGAQSDLALALQSHPDPQERLAAALELARLYRRQGRLDTALEVLAKAKDIALQCPTPEKIRQRAEAEALYAKGDFEPGLKIYEALAAGPGPVAPEDLFRLFWGYYRSQRWDDADKALTRISALALPDWSFRAGFWRGLMLLDKGDTRAAFAALKDLKPADDIDRGFLVWEVARIQLQAGALPDALRSLAAMDRAAPGAGMFVKGEIIKAALATSDVKVYLSGLPDPAEMDQEFLSETALLGLIRQKALANAPAEEIATLNRALRVEAISEDAIEEGNFLEARAKINGPTRAEALTMMDQILARKPDSPYAPQIKYYYGEEAYLKKDYQGAVAWLSQIKVEQAPEKLRYRFLFLAGDSYKMLKSLENMRPYFLALVNNYLGRQGEVLEWQEVGIGLLLVREFTGAIAALDWVIANTQDPKLQAETRYWKGMAQLGNGDPDAARETFLALAQLYPDQGMWVTTALYEAAGICTEKGEYDRALEIYKMVLDRTRGDEKTTAKVKAKIAEVKKLKKLAGETPPGVQPQPPPPTPPPAQPAPKPKPKPLPKPPRPKPQP